MLISSITLFQFFLLYEALARNKMLLGIWYLLYMELKVIEEALPFGMDKNKAELQVLLKRFYWISLKLVWNICMALWSTWHTSEWNFLKCTLGQNLDFVLRRSQRETASKFHKTYPFLSHDLCLSFELNQMF